MKYASKTLLATWGFLIAMTAGSLRVLGDPPSSDQIYTVSKFTLRFAVNRPGQPDSDELMSLPIQLSEGPDGLMGPDAGGKPTILRLSDLTGSNPIHIHWSGIFAISKQLVAAINQRGLIGVTVGPKPGLIEVTADSQGRPVGGKDLRHENDTTMPLIIRTSVVSELVVVDSAAQGTHSALGNAEKKRIASHSPLQPGPSTGGSEVRQGDLLQKKPLDDYVSFLNRYPNRNVNAAIAPGADPSLGEVSLQYLVNQPKPWQVYFQVANVGTRQTNAWRERVGFLDTQLTGNDDTFSVDASTASFEGSDDVTLSYEAPVLKLDRLRWRVSAEWDEFKASDVGFEGANFSGNQESVAADLVWNFLQKDDWFFDATFGVRDLYVIVDNSLAQERGNGNFLLPHAGIEVSRPTLIANTDITADLSTNWADAAGTDSRRIQQLGRSTVNRSWVMFAGSATESFYIEPLLASRNWTMADLAATGRPLPWATLAHELSFSVHGQSAFDSRLPPQEEMTAGGFYTVRGYSEADAVGDSAVIGSAEYRWHIPRSFSPNPRPPSIFNQPFRFAPDVPLGLPDWDLIFRAFVDAGYTMNNHILTGVESNDTLVGTGFGFELDLSRYVSIRTDWGIALHSTPDTRSGSNRFHVQATFTY
ncbi:MAG: ShlB/FhaC/HecB family hemolysin secretion/activation protein [Tepidisphaeraceae bacterium]|jgi:hemolysin activation/secretion protein